MSEGREGSAGPAPEGPFSRVLVGVDGTEPGFEACREAAGIADPGTAIEVVAVVRLAAAIHAGYNAPLVTAELRHGADAALEEAVRLIGERARPHIVDGAVTATLLREIDRCEATLIALGSHGHRRMTEILIGGVAGELLHSAPCSVLVARRPAEAGTFPRSIVAGIDGSAPAEYALDAAEQLAARFRVPLRVITALGGKEVDLDRARRRCPSVEEIGTKPVEGLVEAARAADLLVVGSRGLHGLKALGSVSERVAHRAACSVLVARSRHTG
jgi:nucleotide-binding universal stress UspA family protein